MLAQHLSHLRVSFFCSACSDAFLLSAASVALSTMQGLARRGSLACRTRSEVFEGREERERARVFCLFHRRRRGPCPAKFCRGERGKRKSAASTRSSSLSLFCAPLPQLRPFWMLSCYWLIPRVGWRHETSTLPPRKRRHHVYPLSQQTAAPAAAAARLRPFPLRRPLSLSFLFLSKSRARPPPPPRASDGAESRAKRVPLDLNLSLSRSQALSQTKTKKKKKQ